jgi:hypothetical protein
MHCDLCCGTCIPNSGIAQILSIPVFIIYVYLLACVVYWGIKKTKNTSGIKNKEVQP